LTEFSFLDELSLLMNVQI